MNKKVLCVLFLMVSFGVGAQQVDSLVRFYYKDGSLSSEGYLRDGKPDGYWKTYSQDGKIQSEGNRENYLLDGLWKFYDKDGILKNEHTYQSGIKNGPEKYYEEGILSKVIPFKNNLREGMAIEFYPDGAPKAEYAYLNNELYGKGYEFNRNGGIISLMTYKNGVMVRKQRINRYNHKEEKHGLWVKFYTRAMAESQGTYKNGLKHGYFKYYDRKGNLLRTEKYVNDKLQEDALETAKLEVKRSYYRNKRLQSYKSYRKGVPDGMHIEYAEDGSTSSAVLYQTGIVIARGGSVDDKGRRSGEWEEYYTSGERKAVGNYKNGKKDGKWVYYYINGRIEQEGNYVMDKAEGMWYWYYPSEKLLREEGFVNGKEEGISKEYAEDGTLLAQGEYFDGKKEGPWVFVVNDTKRSGEFSDGLQTGKWIHEDINTGKPLFIGNYYEGLLEGEQEYFFANGKMKSKGKYEAGYKQGEWEYYTEQGLLSIRVLYRDGVDYQYDDVAAADRES